MKFPHGMIIAGFLLGFACAWMLRPLATPQRQHEEKEMAASRTSRQRATAKAHAPSSERYQKHLENIDLAASKRDEKSLSDSLQKIPISDIPGVLEAWQKRAGFSGLGYEEKSQIQKLLAQWYKEDATGAIAWLAALENKEDAQILLDQILVFEAERDWDRTLALLDKFVGGFFLRGFFPDALREKMNACDAEIVGKICRDFSLGFIAQPLEIEFKEDFDFATLGKIIAEDTADYKVAVSYGPSNFIEEWAKKDVHAAFDWSVKNGVFSISDMGKVFFTLTNEVGSKEANKIFIKTLADETTPLNKYCCASFAMQDHASAEQIANFVENLPGSRIDHLEGLANQAKRWDGYSHDEFKSKLLTLMTPEERRLLVPKTYALEKIVDWDLIRSTLKALGHSPEEINAMMPSSGTDSAHKH